MNYNMTQRRALIGGLLLALVLTFLTSSAAVGQLNGTYNGRGSVGGSVNGASNLDDLFQFQFRNGQLLWFSVIENEAIPPANGADGPDTITYCDFVTDTSSCPGPYQYNLLYQYFSSGTTCPGSATGNYTGGIPMLLYGCTSGLQSTLIDMSISQIVITQENKYSEFDFVMNGGYAIYGSTHGCDDCVQEFTGHAKLR